MPADWQRERKVEITSPGLVRFSLPVETLDGARPALEDLRLYDDAGNELPFLIERPAPPPKTSRSAKSFEVSLSPNATVITIETGLTQPLDAVALETPANNFIKPVKIEASPDGKRWQTLAQGRPIFRQPNGAGQLRLAILTAEWRWLRLTVDDQRSQPIPFTGARVHAVVAEPMPGETFPVAIAGRHENPGETRLTLNLGAANLDITSLRLETTEPLFTRQVTLAVAQISEDAIREQTLGVETIYRVAVEGQPAAENLAVSLGAQVRPRELLVLIKNDDSPPLAITAVRAERRPVHLVFLAKSAGVHHLLTGNARCPAPRYDLASLGANLKNVSLTPVNFSAPSDNPDYRAREALADLAPEGAALDISAWKFRKALQLQRAGAQQVELDLNVLAHAHRDFQDLRLMSGGKQIPYILERTSIRRALTPTVTATTDAPDKKLSRWIIKLPQKNLPLTRLSCAARTTLFQRDVALYEELTDERGEKFNRQLGTASWTRTPDRKDKEFTLALDDRLQSDTLILQTHNGDNPPVELEKFQVFHPATRILFKAKADDDLMLYYGNPQVVSPRYDLSLVANQLLAAEKSIATLVAEQQLKKSSWAETHTPGKGGVVFWGILALVVVGLLIVISRLLPKTPQP